ncbi:aminopeptidase N-like isoform X2 [Asterias amurensis]|uniref:aminopeptidase N-like isoform X2 n=1 Tax=Asterias amurensis TaxID=7602 RepID=UPI003AB1DFFA
MGRYVVTRRTAVILFIVFLVVVVLIGLMCGLLTRGGSEPAGTSDPSGAGLWKTTRLPQTLSPVSYELMVRTDMTKFIFSGSVGILFECLEPTDLILIHANNLTVGEGQTTLKRDGGGTAPELLKEPWIYEENQFIVIELDGTLKKGDMYRLYIEFQGPLQEDLAGFYRMSYISAAGEKRFLASTVFEPTDARKAFPCFDEPAMKATFTITLEHEPKYHALANSAKSGDDEILSDGWIRATFKETVKMPTYLVCYVVSDFKAKYKTTASGVTFGVWAREDFINQTDYALEKGSAILDFFDNLFGMDVKYPMDKIDMIALTNFPAGAMENWGLITYQESALLYEEGVSSETQKQLVCGTVAHELVHQWFGNLITPKWWSYIWLNEGFATYLKYTAMVEVEPDWGMGSSVLRMMSFFIGDETFLKGLTYYLEANKYSNVDNSDLWLHLSTALEEHNISLGDDMDLATVMKTWMHQMGFPVIKVKRDYKGNGQITARVEQKRFLSDPTADTTTGHPDLGYLWYVPLTYTTSSSPDFVSPDSKWLRPEDEYVTIETPGRSTDWLLLNIDQRGIYRVNYDDQNWGLIKAQLESNHEAISTASRASLISDAFSLAEASEISQSQAFDMTTYLKEERDYVPWYAVDSALSNIERNLQRTGAFGNFKKYMRGQVTPMYEVLGWNNTGDHQTRLHQGLAPSMACRYNNDECIQASLHLYSQWMASPTNNIVHPDIQPTVYCSAIAAGGQDEWDFAFDVYRNPNTPLPVKDRLVQAMGCSQQPWILSTYLKYILGDAINKAKDEVDAIVAVAHNAVGLPIAWDFFRANWDFIRTRYGDSVFILKDMITGILSNLNTPFELESLERFMADNPDQGTGAEAFTEAVAVVKGNIRWIEQNYKDVDQWLQDAV